MAKNNKKRKKKKSFIRSFFKTVFILLITAVIITAALLYFDPLNLRDLTGKDFSTSNENLYISNEVVFDDEIVNIALIGIDKLKDELQRSDTIVILSYDTQTGRTTITSIMRDLLVYMPDKDMYDKINSAYSYGGEELLLKTINKNLDLNIKYYITVDFGAMETLVDAVGGVEIDVKDYEVKCLNKTIIGSESDYITQSGLQTLDGKQALAYCRIRKVGNSDWERTSRQRKVISAIIDKVKDEMDIAMLMSLSKNVAPMTNTNISTKMMLTMFTSYLKHKDTFVVEDFRLPYDYYSTDEYTNGIYYLKPNTLKDNVILLHKYIYGIDEYTPSGDVDDISYNIKYYH